MNVSLINYNTHCRRKQLFFRGKKDSFLKIPHSGIILYDMKTLILNKALKIFEVLTQAENPLTLKEICRRTGITPPAASRLLSDLAEGGYVHKVSYREFEPGLGMIYLGQGSLRHNFFPQNATQFLQSELRRMGIGGALAGMFNDHLVYLYHSLHEHGHRIYTLPLPDQRLSGSNIALVILCVRYGPERAREVLCSELRANCTGIELERRENSVLRRIEAFRKDHFAVWNDEAAHWNICFPLVDGTQVYGLSFLGENGGQAIPPQLFLDCSAVAAKMRRIFSGVSG